MLILTCQSGVVYTYRLVPPDHEGTTPVVHWLRVVDLLHPSFLGCHCLLHHQNDLSPLE